MSATRDWLVRSVTCATIRTATIESAKERRSPQSKPGVIKVDTASGSSTELHFDAKFTFDVASATSEDAGELHGILQRLWPGMAGKRKLREFGDGLRLCDMAAALRSDVHGVGLIEYGALNGWWKIVLDENITCPDASASCPQHCTAYVDGYKRAIGRKKRKKEKAKVPILSKFRLPDLFPERGVAIA